jgi:hypothetical protein
MVVTGEAVLDNPLTTSQDTNEQPPKIIEKFVVGKFDDEYLKTFSWFCSKVEPDTINDYGYYPTPKCMNLFVFDNKPYYDLTTKFEDVEVQDTNKKKPFKTAIIIEGKPLNVDGAKINENDALDFVKDILEGNPVRNDNIEKPEEIKKLQTQLKFDSYELKLLLNTTQDFNKKKKGRKAGKIKGSTILKLILLILSCFNFCKVFFDL